MLNDLSKLVAATAEALNADAGIADEEDGFAVMLTVLSPVGEVQTISNMSTDAYREFFRFMAAQTAAGEFTTQEVIEGEVH